MSIKETAKRHTEGPWLGFLVCRGFENGESETFILRAFDKNKDEFYSENYATPIFPTKRGERYFIVCESPHVRVVFCDDRLEPLEPQKTGLLFVDVPDKKFFQVIMEAGYNGSAVRVNIKRAFNDE